MRRFASALTRWSATSSCRGWMGTASSALSGPTPRRPKSTFIFLTAKADRNDVRAGMNLGADDYLTKPFRNAELLEAIRTRIARVEAMASSRRPDAARAREPRTDNIVITDPAMIALYEKVPRGERRHQCPLARGNRRGQRGRRASPPRPLATREQGLRGAQLHRARGASARQ